ncbi:MAG: MoaD/ThiS family protein [Anaerolineales bacterium]|nr:MoaD/ThiS family protein [Anaerolineales bacterium]
MATLRIPTPLRPYTDGVSEINVEGNNVSEALKELTAQYPAIATHIFTEAGELRSFVNLFLNEEDVRHLQGVETEIKADDRLMIIPSIAGG